MTVSDALTIIRGHASSSCKIGVEIDPIWGFTVTIDDRAFSYWEKTTQRPEDVLELAAIELEARYA